MFSLAFIIFVLLKFICFIFQTLLSQHYDKHPIIILKDVKFPELRAMLDYMYRGEVNISQDLLGSFLKAAESLQIKGLTDSGGGNELHNKQQECSRKQSLPVNQMTTLTNVVNNHIPHSNNSNSNLSSYPEERKNLTLPSHVLDSRSQSPLLAREGSISPVRKRKKLNQLNKTDNPKLVRPHNDIDNSCQNKDQQTSQILASSPATMTVIKSEPDLLPLSNKTEFKQNINDNNVINEDPDLDNDENNENIYENDNASTTSPGPSHHFISQGENLF